jgi:hypothetical protein
MPLRRARTSATRRCLPLFDFTRSEHDASAGDILLPPLMLVCRRHAREKRKRRRAS